MPTENSAASVGGNGTRDESQSSTLANEVLAVESYNSNNSEPPTREGIQNRRQALAVLWPGLEWLAMNGQADLFNSVGEEILWIGIHKARASGTGIEDLE